MTFYLWRNSRIRIRIHSQRNGSADPDPYPYQKFHGSAILDTTTIYIFLKMYGMRLYSWVETGSRTYYVLSCFQNILPQPTAFNQFINTILADYRSPSRTPHEKNFIFLNLEEAIDSLSSVSKKEVVSISLERTEAASLRNTPPCTLQFKNNKQCVSSSKISRW